MMTTVIDVEAVENSMQTSIDNLAGEVRRKGEESCVISRVFHSVRIGNGDAYDPHIIAIGPFHHANNLLKSEESLKWRYLKQLMQRNPQKKTLQDYVGLISAHIKEARSYYSAQVEPDDNVFVEMMVLDGCFLIEFLFKSYRGNDVSDRTTNNFDLLRRDLMLLENQFPFPVLALLFGMSDFTGVTLMDLVVSFVTRKRFKTLQVFGYASDTVQHLLHAYHVSVCVVGPVPDSKDNQPTSCCCGLGAMTIKMLKGIKKLVSIPFLWLLSSLVYCRISLNCCRKSPARLTDNERPSRILPATQLLACGIKFKGVTSGTCLFGKFCKETGVMQIGKLEIHKATISEFYNLIAFEQCNQKERTHFTRQAVLMNNLISTPEDVAILKRNGIIESTLASDEEVVQFFNKICKGMYVTFQISYDNKLFCDVTEYCNVASHQWRAQLDYFGKPWATVSVFVAVVLLILTFLSTFYAMYAYHHPRS